ncbi:hypothetical protein HP398_00645 [Brevibacillus sp. HB1.4B]|uniref:hypothetical protein n=1 Tax=Brevibacillus sp. HB1.4B TaxID=2738845 RepID=UPI00156AE00C|nr:hypothetical protein [Brevibacillus sp. HB1.4B]NRS14940.1 hypothetical protein [Brevibacillus sp. HB1.4B]
MAKQAPFYRILIASPSDLHKERKVIRDAINTWNTQNADIFNIIFLPTMWETNTVPTMGDRPQEIINQQIVDKSDLLLGVFWTRIGSPTGSCRIWNY